MKWITLFLMLLLTGCMTSLMPQTPQTRIVELQASPDEAYRRAAVAMNTMGAEQLQANNQLRLLSGKVHGAVLLNVSVLPTTEGAAVHVRGSLLPGKLVIGSVDEVDQYVALLR
jgi:hypothetical protein